MLDSASHLFFTPVLFLDSRLCGGPAIAPVRRTPSRFSLQADVPSILIVHYGGSGTTMSTLTDVPTGKTKREVIEQAVIRFAGDSGDGMQITGSQFTNTVALYGNDMATFPDYPAEIRAPAGTEPGVSGYQINFSSTEVHTPGDSIDVLIAMNPAALKVNVPTLSQTGS